MNEQVILINARYCSTCMHKVESKFRHDYQTCKCGTVMVDGGKDYLKSSGRGEDLSKVCDPDNYKLISEYWEWGTYGPKGLDPKKYILLKDLEYTHMENIIINCTGISPTISNTLVWLLKNKTTRTKDEFINELTDIEETLPSMLDKAIKRRKIKEKQ